MEGARSSSRSVWVVATTSVAPLLRASFWMLNATILAVTLSSVEQNSSASQKGFPSSIIRAILYLYLWPSLSSLYPLRNRNASLSPTRLRRLKASEKLPPTVSTMGLSSSISSSSMSAASSPRSSRSALRRADFPEPLSPVT
ncbi:hypothetical protein ES703_01863 [subsurface metagenome]